MVEIFIWFYFGIWHSVHRLCARDGDTLNVFHCWDQVIVLCEIASIFLPQISSVIYNVQQCSIIFYCESLRCFQQGNDRDREGCWYGALCSLWGSVRRGEREKTVVGGELKALMRAVKRVTGGSSAAVQQWRGRVTAVQKLTAAAAAVLSQCTHHIAMFTVQATAEQSTSIGGGWDGVQLRQQLDGAHCS